jgi:predicted N-formylglutamate amidohydrolase
MPPQPVDPTSAVPNADAHTSPSPGANAGLGAGSIHGAHASATAGSIHGAGFELLDPDEPAPFLAERHDGRSNFVIVVDHAGARIPRRLGTLGVATSELQRHIAWDIGSLGLARRLAASLDAPLVAQNYSRLVIDCNRDPRTPTSIAPVSEWTEIPGNLGLSEDERAARRAEIFDPYHACIRALLDAREAAGRLTILVAQHTMTDVYKGVRRAMHGAVLYNRDRRFAGLVLDRLRREPGLIFGDNEPYFVSDETDYTIPRHGEMRGLPHVEIEIRQDLVKEEAGQAAWAERVSRALEAAQAALWQAQ